MMAIQTACNRENDLCENINKKRNDWCSQPAGTISFSSVLYVLSLRLCVQAWVAGACMPRAKSACVFCILVVIEEGVE